MNTFAEENYLKAIFKLSGKQKVAVSTNTIADELETKASSVTDMIKELTEKTSELSEIPRSVSQKKDMRLLFTLSESIGFGKCFC